MNENLNIEKLLLGENNISLESFVVNLLLAFLLSYLLSKIYIKCGRSLSNRSSFAENFTLITMTTMTIISIVKSSLALSLGLVGALSIVRFRTALKEPEELSYTFLCIAIGLGLGANQTLLTFASFIIITTSIALRNKYFIKNKNTGMNLVISSNSGKDINIDILINEINEFCGSIDLKRVSQSDKQFQSSLVIDIKSYKDIELIRSKLVQKFPYLEIDFTDNSNILY